MAITTLDQRTALVLIDLQKGVAQNTVPPAAGVIANAISLITAFRAAQLPIVAVNVSFAKIMQMHLKPAPRKKAAAHLTMIGISCCRSCRCSLRIFTSLSTTGALFMVLTLTCSCGAAVLPILCWQVLLPALA